MEAFSERYVKLLDTPDTLLLGDLAMSGAGNCPHLKDCMRGGCVGACTDVPPEPEPGAA
jgi:hypothetical protein